MSTPKKLQPNILIVSSSEKVSISVTRVLRESRYHSLEVRTSAAHARRERLERSYDIAVIHMPLTDEPGVELAIDFSTKYPMGVIILASAEISEDVAEKVTDYGIFVISKPVRARELIRSVRLMCALQGRVTQAIEKAQTLEEKMSEIRIVNRAKWHLIDTQGMSEEEAHKYIEKQAMDRCITRREVAEEVLS